MDEIHIETKQRVIKRIFCDEFVFTIPMFQRPYAWTTEQADELVEDIIAFMDDSVKADELTPYFLGSIVLAKGSGSTFEVIDGQQRLTTLTILLSVLRSLVSGNVDKGALTSLIYEEGSKILGTERSYRLKLRKQDETFFQHYIQDAEGIGKLKDLNQVLEDSQRNIRDNALLFLKQLEGFSEQKLLDLANYIATRCCLVVVSTQDIESAYRIFSVLNDRGLPLSHTDILKAEIIGKIDMTHQEAYNAKWEELEAVLGRDMFQNLFMHIRTIYRKAKARDTILKEFRLYVRPKDNPRRFIDDVLEPYGDAFFTIKKESYKAIKMAKEVNNLFKWLNQIDNSDRLPPAILYLAKNENNPDQLVRFFTDLERLAVALMILRANVNKRIERYGRLLTAIENNDDLFASDSPLQLTGSEQAEVVKALDGELYGWGYCKYVLLRLDDEEADNAVSFNHPIITIEHVLPQTPQGEWLQLFPDKEKREEYVHRLGNLVLLSRKKNAAAQNFDFKEKVCKYFMQGNVALFALTVRVQGEGQWTPEVIERRQQELLAKLKKIWRLN